MCFLVQVRGPTAPPKNKDLEGAINRPFRHTRVVGYNACHEWSNVLEQAKVTNEMQGFTGQFWKTGATIKWSSNQAGFSFDSEAPNPTRNIYSVIGHEHSGAFFH